MNLAEYARSVREAIAIAAGFIGKEKARLAELEAEAQRQASGFCRWRGRTYLLSRTASGEFVRAGNGRVRARPIERDEIKPNPQAVFVRLPIDELELFTPSLRNPPKEKQQ